MAAVPEVDVERIVVGIEPEVPLDLWMMIRVGIRYADPVERLGREPGLPGDAQERCVYSAAPFEYGRLGVIASIIECYLNDALATEDALPDVEPDLFGQF